MSSCFVIGREVKIVFRNGAKGVAMGSKELRGEREREGEREKERERERRERERKREITLGSTNSESK